MLSGLLFLQNKEPNFVGGFSLRDSEYIALSQMVFNTQNRIRTNPVSFANELTDPVAANILKTQAVPTHSLIYSGKLRLAAHDLIADQGPKGTVGHNSSNGDTPFDRMNKHGTWVATAGENIMYGSGTAQQILIALIKSPQHFQNIFNPAYKVCGMSCGPHKIYGTMTVLDYAGGMI